MAIKKIGSPQKIVVMKNSAFEYDPSLIATRIKETWQHPTMTKDQLHEAIKSLGIVNYNPDDMQKVINLLNSSGIQISQ